VGKNSFFRGERSARLRVGQISEKPRVKPGAKYKKELDYRQSGDKSRITSGMTGFVDVPGGVIWPLCLQSGGLEGKKQSAKGRMGMVEASGWL